MMAGLGLRLERSANLHFRVSAAGFATLTTHVFDRADPAIGHDALFGVKPALLYDFRPIQPGTAPVESALDVQFVLCPDTFETPHIRRAAG